MAMETGRCYGGGVCVERQKMRAREEKEGMWECYFIYYYFFSFLVFLPVIFLLQISVLSVYTHIHMHWKNYF